MPLSIARSAPAMAVQPVLIFGSDTVVVTSAAAMRAALDASFLNVRQWYWDNLREGVGGWTFRLLPTISAVSASTEATLTTTYGFPQHLLDIASAAGLPTRGPHRFLQLMAPFATPDVADAGNAVCWAGYVARPSPGFTVMGDAVCRLPAGETVGGIVVGPAPGSAGTSFVLSPGQGWRFHWGHNGDVPDAPYAVRIWSPSAGSFDVAYEPGIVTALTGDTLTVTRGTPRFTVAVGDYIAVAGTTPRLVGDQVQIARGAIAHEIGHGFGLVHPPPDAGAVPGDPDGGSGRLMGGDFRVYPSCIFTAWERQILLGDSKYLGKDREPLPPYLAYYAARPTSLND